ncbi:MAG: hypothetical protein CMI63_17345 [Parvularcula sp.]|nr:hypothetical protein [Parvularcula sp.]
MAAVSGVTRHRNFANAAAGVIAAISGKAAAAQDIFIASPPDVAGKRPQPAYDAKGFDFHGVKLLPRIDSGVRLDSNVLSSGVDAQSDGVAFLSANADIRYVRPRHAVQLSLSADANRYFDITQQNRNNYAASLSALGLIGPSTTYAARAAFRDQEAARGTVENDLGFGAPLERKTADFAVGFSHDFGGFGLRNEATFSKVDYSDIETAQGDIDQDFRDRNTVSNSTTASIDASERLSFLVNGTISKNDFTNEEAGVSRDSQSVSAGAGFAYNLTELISSSVIVGYRKTTFDDDSFSDFDGVSIAASVDWHPTPLISVSINSGQEILTSAFSQVDAITVTRSSATVDYELLRNFIVTGMMSYARENFENLNATAERYEAQIGGDYKLNRHLALGVRASYADRSLSPTAAPGQNFERYTLAFKLSVMA